MSEAEKLFHSIAQSIPNTIEGKMFGALCIKAENGKAGVMFWKDEMVFKLNEIDLEKALELDNAKIFEPSPGKKMGGWVQLSNIHANSWDYWAQKSMHFVKSL